MCEESIIFTPSSPYLRDMISSSSIRVMCEMCQNAKKMITFLTQFYYLGYIINSGFYILIFAPIFIIDEFVICPDPKVVLCS
jgi:hypothetical protein